jgi:membrane protein
LDLGTAETIIDLSRWAILLAVALVGLGIVYAQGPDRKPPAWLWLTPGALAGCAAWIAASIGLSIYVENFADYNAAFGALAGVILLLVWLWISAFIVLLGAEINSAVEAHGPRSQA